MEFARNRLYAVITGDIVGSSRLTVEERRKAQALLASEAQELGRTLHVAPPLKAIVLFRGDSWQLIVKDPVLSLRVGLSIRTHLRAGMASNTVDTRLSIGVGTIEFVPSDNISAGDGEAFRRSGEGLDHRMKTVRLVVELEPGDDPLRREALGSIIQLMDALVTGLTHPQAQAVHGALAGGTQETIGVGWRPKPISQQAVAQHLDKAGWHALCRGLEFFETYLRKAVPAAASDRPSEGKTKELGKKEKPRRTKNKR